LKAARELAKAKYGGDEGKALLEIQRQETVGTQFKDIILKLKEAFVDIVSKVEPIAKQLAEVIAKVAASPLTKLALTMGVGLSAVISLAKLLMSTLRGTDMMPMVVRMAGMGAGGLLGGGGAVSQGRHPAGTVIDGKNVGGQYMSKTPPPRGMNTGMGMGLGMAGMAVGGMMMSSESEGMQIGGAALAGAGTGAMIGSMFTPAGMAVGAGIGAAIGGLTAYLSKKDAEEEKSKKTQDDSYSEMIKLLRMQAEKDVDIYMDSNKVGQQIVIGGYQTNSKINHT